MQLVKNKEGRGRGSGSYNVLRVKGPSKMALLLCHQFISILSGGICSPMKSELL